jgi:hypothetical protein
MRQQCRCISFSLWCDENWGYFFDDLIVNEGIVVYPLDFFPIWKISSDVLKPKTISSNRKIFQHGKISTDYL